jgi:hypothetical protein
MAKKTAQRGKSLLGRFIFADRLVKAAGLPGYGADGAVDVCRQKR